RRVAREGAVRFLLADDDTFDDLFDQWLHLHAARWRARGQPGVLAIGAVQAFHRTAARNFLQSGMLRLYGLQLSGRTIGCLYGVQHRRRTYFYLSGFDPRYKQLSPGVLLLAHAVEAAMQEGSHAFDFLRGREPYKYAWGARDHANYV